MANVFDVASYILEQHGAMSTMKLQKLCYYSKAWHLVWEETPLYPEVTQAWANGPVVPSLYQEHKSQYTISELTRGDKNALTDVERESIDIVLRHYGSMKAFELSDLTHRESPWLNARGDAAAGERSNAVITDQDMYEYYDGLVGVGER